MVDQAGGAGFHTLALHAGMRATRDARRFDDRPSCLGGLVEPVHDAETALLEDRVAALEGGTAAVAFASSGGAAFAACQALLRPGDDIVVAQDGVALRDLADAFRAGGWIVRQAPPDGLVDALTDRSRAILVEGVASRDGAPTDIGAAARIARRARLPLLVDNSVATPFLLRPFEHGADIVLHDARPYLGGIEAGFVVDGGSFDWAYGERYPTIAADDGNGVDAGNFALAAACRRLGRRALGAPLAGGPVAMLLHGLETLGLRMRRHADGALAVARHLERHPAVSRVHHAGLDGDPGRAHAERTLPAGTGAVFTLDLAGDAAGFIGRLRLFARSGNGGGSRSTAWHLTEGGSRHRVRLAVGLEDEADLVADLDQALAS